MRAALACSTSPGSGGSAAPDGGTSDRPKTTAEGAAGDAVYHCCLDSNGTKSTYGCPSTGAAKKCIGLPSNFDPEACLNDCKGEASCMDACVQPPQATPDPSECQKVN